MTGLRNGTWIRWLPAVGMMALIFLFSSIPSRSMPEFGMVDLLIKKGGHMLGYALLARAYLFGLGARSPKAGRFAWLLAVAYAASDEFHQTFVPGRGAWVVDVGVDAVGAALGLVLPFLLQKWPPGFKTV